MYGRPEDDAVLVTRGGPSGSAWKKSWKIEKAELAEIMTRRSLCWKLSKALEQSGASHPCVPVALLNFGRSPRSIRGPQPPLFFSSVPCSRPFGFFYSSTYSLRGYWLYALLAVRC